MLGLSDSVKSHSPTAFPIKVSYGKKSGRPKFQDSRLECQATVGGESARISVSLLCFCFFIGRTGKDSVKTGKKGSIDMSWSSLTICERAAITIDLQ